MLNPCPACNRQVSVAAPYCPGCGHPIAAGSEPQAGSNADLRTAGEPPALGLSERAGAEYAVLPEHSSSDGTQEGSQEAADAPTTAQDKSAEGEDGSAPDSAERYPTISGADQPSSKPDRARDIPGSVPAAVLMLFVVGLNLIGRAMDPSSHPSMAPTCVSVIIALGLLLGGPGFREWGKFSNVLGLFVWPIILATGVFRPASAADYVGLTFNIGILMLLAGAPSNLRVGWGVAVCISSLVLTLVVGSVEGNIRAGSEPAPSADASLWTEPTSVTQVDADHEPQTVKVSRELGGLSFIVPSELPKVYLDASKTPSPLHGAFSTAAAYAGSRDEIAITLLAFQLKPNYTYSLDEGLEGMAKALQQEAIDEGLDWEEQLRSEATLAGVPSRSLMVRTGKNGVWTSYRCYEVLHFGSHVYTFYIAALDERTRDSEAVRQLLASVTRSGKKSAR